MAAKAGEIADSEDGVGGECLDRPRGELRCDRRAAEPQLGEHAQPSAYLDDLGAQPALWLPNQGAKPSVADRPGLRHSHNRAAEKRIPRAGANFPEPALWLLALNSHLSGIAAVAA